MAVFKDACRLECFESDVSCFLVSDITGGGNVGWDGIAVDFEYSSLTPELARKCCSSRSDRYMYTDMRRILQRMLCWIGECMPLNVKFPPTTCKLSSSDRWASTKIQ